MIPLLPLGEVFPVDKQFEVAILSIGNDVAAATRANEKAVHHLPAAGQGLHLVATPAVKGFCHQREV